ERADQHAAPAGQRAGRHAQGGRRYLVDELVLRRRVDQAEAAAVGGGGTGGRGRARGGGAESVGGGGRGRARGGGRAGPVVQRDAGERDRVAVRPGVIAEHRPVPAGDVPARAGHHVHVHVQAGLAGARA